MDRDELRRLELARRAANLPGNRAKSPLWRARLRAGERMTLHRRMRRVGGRTFGPYWFATWTKNKRTVRSYVGKTLPRELVELRRAQRAALGLD